MIFEWTEKAMRICKKLGSVGEDLALFFVVLAERCFQARIACIFITATTAIPLSCPSRQESGGASRR